MDRSVTMPIHTFKGHTFCIDLIFYNNTTVKEVFPFVCYFFEHVLHKVFNCLVPLDLRLGTMCNFRSLHAFDVVSLCTWFDSWSMKERSVSVCCDFLCTVNISWCFVSLKQQRPSIKWSSYIFSLAIKHLEVMFKIRRGASVIIAYGTARNVVHH